MNLEFSSQWLDWVAVGAYLGITIVVAIAVFTSEKK